MATKWINTNGGNWGDVANWDNGLPSATNSAIFDTASFLANGKIVTLNSASDCLDIDFSALAYNVSLISSVYSLNIWGNVVLSNKLTWTFTATAYTYLKATTAKNLTMNGCTPNLNRLYFDGVGGSWTNQDDWNVGSTTIYHANGEWKLSNYISTILLYTTQAGTKTLTMDSGTIICNSFSGSPTTFNIGTGTIEVRIVSTPVASTPLLAYNLKIIGYNSISSIINFGGNTTVSNTLTISGNNAQNYRLLIASNTIGTPRTITVNGSIVASNVDFRDITLAGTANRDLSTISGGSGDCGGNSGITFTPAQTQYYKHTSGACNWSDATKWVTSSGGSTQGRVPLPQDDPIFDQNSFTGASTLSVNCPRIGRSLNMEAVNQTVTFSLANNVEFYGSFIYGEMLQNITSNELYAMGRGNFNLDFKGKSIFTFKTLTTNVSIYNFVNNVTITRSFNPISGKLLLNYSIITLTANNIASFSWSGGILEAGNYIIKISPISGSAVVEFKGSGLSLNKVIFSGQHTGNFIISGNNTFNELIIEKGRKVQITGGSTQTISPTGKLTADGTPTEQIQITSTNTTPFNLVYAGTGFHQVNYCNISYSNATANRFYAGTNSTNGGNNTGWIFKNYLTKYTTIVKRKLKLIN